MKNIIKLVFVTLVFVSGQLSAATVTWGPATKTVGANNVFTMDVVGLGFTSNVELMRMSGTLVRASVREQ